MAKVTAWARMSDLHVATVISTMSRKVIVVGAGVSGIAAGVELQQRGFDVTLLEKNDYVGGRVQSISRDGFVMEKGASILPSNYRNILDCLQAQGLSGLLQPGGSKVGFARGNEIHNLDSARLGLDALTTKLISFPSKLKMLNLIVDNFRAKSSLSYENGGLAARFDTESAAEYCRRRLNPELLEYIVEATLRGMLGTPAEDNSIVDFYFAFNNVIGSKLYSMQGGMGTMPNAIAKTAGLKIELNTLVNEVVEGNGRVSVSYSGPQGERNEDVDGVVMTLPANHVTKILPGFPQHSIDFLKTVDYTRVISVNLALSAPPPNQPSFVIQIPRSVQPDLFAIVLDHNKAPGRTPPGKGMASLYTMSAWAEKLLPLDDDTVLRKTLAAAERVLPHLGDKIEFVNINRWNEVIVYGRKGLYQATAKFIAGLDPNSRIKLGGDYFSCGNMNTSFAAGERAARELAQTLGMS